MFSFSAIQRALRRSAARIRPNTTSPFGLEPLESRHMLTAFFVDSIGDDASGTTDGFVSLREAIIAAETDMPFGDAPVARRTGIRLPFPRRCSVKQ